MWCLGEDRASLAGKTRSALRSSSAAAGLIAPMPRRPGLGDQVDHLAADHPRRTGRIRQAPRSARSATAGSPCVSGCDSTSNAIVSKPVAGEHRGRVVERLVAGRPAAPQVAVIHRREVVMDQRIGVDHLDRRGDLQRAAPGDAEQPGARQHQQRPQPLAGRQRRIGIAS